MPARTNPVPVLSDSTLDLLAVAPLPYLRTTRFLGQERSISLEELREDDRELVWKIYDLLGNLDLAAPQHDAQTVGPLSAIDSAALRDLLRALGQHGSYAPESCTRAVLHDVRGGAAAALLGALEWLRLAPTPEQDNLAIRLLARDQRKIMRSAIRDLDAQRRALDLSFRPHTTAQLMRGLRALTELPKTVRLSIDCRFDGPVSACCVELGSLERVLYNFVNNASRHASNGQVGVWLLPVASSSGHDVRIVSANYVEAEHELTLDERFGTDLRGLFDGEFSTTGSGIGLHACAELVAGAFGVPSAKQAVDGGYIGAQLMESRFVSWFHWPALRERDH